MSDGYGNGLYPPITDADILSEQDVGDIIGLLPPPFSQRMVRHMMATERKFAKPVSDAMTLISAYSSVTDLEAAKKLMGKAYHRLLNTVEV